MFDETNKKLCIEVDAVRLEKKEIKLNEIYSIKNTHKKHRFFKRN